jgi:hypothetical protein
MESEMPFCPAIKDYCKGKQCICFIIKKLDNDVFCKMYERSFMHWKNQ